MYLWQAFLTIIIFTITIGFRHEVGTDWFNYLVHVDRTIGLNLAEVTTFFGDPAYNTLNWLFSEHPLGVYGVNLISALIFASGLVFFCRSQPSPWLSLCFAVPYLVIVVSMGYTRQAVAIGLTMPALIALERDRLVLFILLTLAATLFHSSALVMFAWVLPAVPGRTFLSKSLQVLLVLIVFISVYQTIAISRAEQLVAGYIQSSYESEGAFIRILMNLLPALLLLSSPSRFIMSSQQLRLWKSISFTAVLCALALFLFPSNSTAIDRIALYVLPLQLVVGSRLPSTGFLGLTKSTLTLWCVSSCVLVQFVWLNFSNHGSDWLPYQNFLFL